MPCNTTEQPSRKTALWVSVLVTANESLTPMCETW